MARRVCQAGISRTSPIAIMMMAATTRNTLASSPREKPATAISNPNPVNEMASPAASASGPQRCCVTAAPSTMGSSGNTHGDRIDSSPAANASAMMVTADQRPLSSRAAIESRLVSPTDRPTSELPL